MPGPKSGEKGFPSAGGVGDAAETGRCADVAAGILQSAGDLCGVLVVAVVAPLCGDGSARSKSSPQRLAVDELRRLVDQRQQQEDQQTAQSQHTRPNAHSQPQPAAAPSGSTTVPSGKTAAV